MNIRVCFVMGDVILNAYQGIIRGRYRFIFAETTSRILEYLSVVSINDGGNVGKITVV